MTGKIVLYIPAATDGNVTQRAENQPSPSRWSPGRVMADEVGFTICSP